MVAVGIKLPTDPDWWLRLLALIAEIVKLIQQGKDNANPTPVE